MFWLAGYTGRVFFPGIHLEQELNTSFRDKAPFLFDTCQAVYDKHEKMLAPEHRRLTVVQAGAAGAAVVANGGESTGVAAAVADLNWTEHGGVVVDDLAPFEVKNLLAVFIALFAFCFIAVVHAVWSYRRAALRTKLANKVREDSGIHPKGATLDTKNEAAVRKATTFLIEAAVRKVMSTTVLEVQATASSRVVETKLAATSSQD